MSTVEHQPDPRLTLEVAKLREEIASEVAKRHNWEKQQDHWDAQQRYWRYTVIIAVAALIAAQFWPF